MGVEKRCKYNLVKLSQEEIENLVCYIIIKEIKFQLEIRQSRIWIVKGFLVQRSYSFLSFLYYQVLFLLFLELQGLFCFFLVGFSVLGFFGEVEKCFEK